MEENRENCIKCQIKTDEPLRVCETGISKLQEYATLLMDDRIEKMLKSSIRVHIHPSCQRNIGNSMRKHKNETTSEKETTKSKIPKTRQSFSQFDWKQHCFFCVIKCQIDERHPDRTVHKVTFLHYRKKILQICDVRGEKWTEKVRERVVLCIGLIQADAICHGSYGIAKGWPKNESKQNIFDVLCEWLETEAESHSLSEIYKEMNRCL